MIVFTFPLVRDYHARPAGAFPALPIIGGVRRSAGASAEQARAAFDEALEDAAHRGSRLSERGKAPAPETRKSD